MCKQIINHVLAGYPVLYVETSEPHRAQASLAAELEAVDVQTEIWDCATGLNHDGENTSPAMPMDALTQLATSNSPSTVLFAHNLHKFWEDPEIFQRIINGSQLWKGAAQTLVIIGPPSPTIPAELSKLVQLLSYDLPDMAHRQTRLEKILDDNKDAMKGKKLSPEKIAAVCEAGTGLTLDEFENAAALSFTEKGTIDPASVLFQKAQMVKKNSSLEYYQADNDKGLNNLAGLENLKAFCRQAARSEHGRGVLLLGIPGTGKSEFAKGLGSDLGLPTVILNIGRLFGSLVGESEQKTRDALRVIDNVAPCVLMIDEIEKGLSGIGSSGSTDGGTSSRVFGTFLSWLQDHKSRVYVVATCNDISKLPPEFSRAERWDAVFFLDLPNDAEKSAIFDMYYKHFSIDPKTERPIAINYTGAEIRSLCRTSAMLGCTPAQATKYVIPIANSRGDMINDLRTWAQHSAVPATEAQLDDEATATRKIRTAKGA